MKVIKVFFVLCFGVVLAQNSFARGRGRNNGVYSGSYYGAGNYHNPAQGYYGGMYYGRGFSPTHGGFYGANGRYFSPGPIGTGTSNPFYGYGYGAPAGTGVSSPHFYGESYAPPYQPPR